MSKYNLGTGCEIETVVYEFENINGLLDTTRFKEEAEELGRIKHELIRRTDHEERMNNIYNIIFNTTHDIKQELKSDISEQEVNTTEKLVLQKVRDIESRLKYNLMDYFGDKIHKENLMSKSLSEIASGKGKSVSSDFIKVEIGGSSSGKSEIRLNNNIKAIGSRCKKCGKMRNWHTPLKYSCNCLDIDEGDLEDAEMICIDDIISIIKDELYPPNNNSNWSSSKKWKEGYEFALKLIKNRVEEI